MKKTLNILLAILSIVFYSCSKEYELQESVFIEDPYSPGLPMYTEWGYNTFGAYFDRDVYTQGSAVPLKVISRTTGTTFQFLGVVQSDFEDIDVQLEFKFSDFRPGEYTDLIDLHDTTINLLDTNSVVSIKIGGDAKSTELLNGELIFKRAQNLYVDTYLEEVILSGYFHLQVVIDSIPVSIDDGRFDMGVGSRNFFVY